MITKNPILSELDHIQFRCQRLLILEYGWDGLIALKWLQFYVYFNIEPAVLKSTQQNDLTFISFDYSFS